MNVIDTDPGTPGLFVHLGAGLADLVEPLAASLSRPFADPFTTRVVSVPAAGVERWLSQALARRLGTSGHGDGVLAGVEMPTLGALERRAVREALGEQPGANPWEGASLTAVVARALGDVRDDPSCAILAAHVFPPGGERSRWWVSAARIARLFEGYLTERPDLVREWTRGVESDPVEGDAGPDRAWQPVLWRRCLERVGDDPLERLERACARLVAEPEVVDLPPVLDIVGMPSLPPGRLAVVQALAASRRVDLWVPHAGVGSWPAVARVSTGEARWPVPRAQDATALAVRHPLSRRLGRQAREFQQVVQRVGAPVHLAAPAASQRSTLLGRLRDDLRHDRPPSPEPLASDDSSVRLHVSHGPDRQVEVLRDVVLGALADDPSLELRDIVVLCPDVEEFAPLLEAAFPRTPGPGEVALRVQLADRSLRQVNPLLATLDAALALAEGRFGVSDLLDFCALEPVRRRFGWRGSDLDRLATLCRESGMRWGLDAEHRRAWSMGHVGTNTVQAGLDRLLVGIAMSSHGWQHLGTALPMDAVDADAARLAGGLAELVARLRVLTDAARTPRPLSEWIDLCRAAVEGLAAPDPQADWELPHAWGALAEVDPELTPAGAGSEVGLTIADVRAALAEALRGRPTRTSFATGALTVCTLTPLRSVPHRMVVLLGMDDERFPRRHRADGDDLRATAPRVGESDPRAEDRQLLLDAVAAASERLVVISSGADETSGATRSPCVPVQELRETLSAMIESGSLAALEVRHPLQPFHPDAFSGPSPSFDALSLRAARAARGEHGPAPDWWRRPAPSSDATAAPTTGVVGGDAQTEAERSEVALADLVAVLTNPARGFLSRTAGLGLFEDEPPADELPLDLDGLEQWQLGDRALGAALSGIPLPAVRDSLLLRGELPPGELGAPSLRRIGEQVTGVLAGAGELSPGPARALAVTTSIGDVVLTGRVDGVHDRELRTIQYGTVRPQHRLAAWIRLLALSAAEPGEDWRAVLVGRGGRPVRLGPVGLADARARLGELIALHRLALAAPMPLPPDLAFWWARVSRDREVLDLRRHGGDLRKEWARSSAARTEWTRLWPDLDALVGEQAGTADRAGHDRLASERSRFAVLARRLWSPLLLLENAEATLAGSGRGATP